VLKRHGLAFLAGRGDVALKWSARGGNGVVEGTVVLVTTTESGLARATARELLPEPTERKDDLSIELDPLMIRAEVTKVRPGEAHFFSTLRGPARLLHDIVDQYISASVSRPRRIILGDLAVFDAAQAPDDWYEAFRTLLVLTVELGWDVPVIAWASSVRTPEALTRSADATVSVAYDRKGDQIVLHWTSKWHAVTRTLSLSAATFLGTAAAPPRLPRRRIPHGRFAP